jgi:hypothetical protein
MYIKFLIGFFVILVRSFRKLLIRFEKSFNLTYTLEMMLV